MNRQRGTWLRGLSILTLGFVCFAKTPQLTGKIVAYDLLAHAGKVGSFVENKEIVILEAPAHKAKYIKLVVQGYGTVQIDPKYFSGDAPLTVRADRDKTCDEGSPVILAQVPNPKPGTYLLTDAYKSSPPAKIKNLECYVANAEKK
jgi:hypothetical protein